MVSMSGLVGCLHKPLIVQAKRKLRQPGRIQLRTDDAERRIALRLARCAKLHTVEDIEELRSELELETFREVDGLKHGKVEVRNSGRAHARERAVEVTESRYGRRDEAGLVEPGTQPRLGRAGYQRIATAYVIRPRTTAKRIRGVCGRPESEGIALLK